MAYPEQPKRGAENSTLLWVAGASAVMLLCICLIAGLAIGGFLVFGISAPAVAVNPPANAQNPPSVTMAPIVEPPPFAPSAELPELAPGGLGEAVQTRDSIAAALVPDRDRVGLAVRLSGIPDPATSIETPDYQVGDVIPFTVNNLDTEESLEIDAELVYANDVVYMWVEQGVDYDLNAIEESAEVFATEIYPTNTSTFGSEPNPGVDNDSRVHILHSTQLGFSIAGYFGSSDVYPRAIVPDSNEKEMFYINISNTYPGTADYESTIAHEFQHMIHFNVDGNESTWLNEGMSEMAAFLNGYGASGFIPFYLSSPWIQLTDWPENESTLPNYGGAFLFSLYFYDRFGREATEALVENDLEGMDSVSDTLAAFGEQLEADEVFADWVVANLLNDPDVLSPSGEVGLYAYESIENLGSPAYVNFVSSFPFDQTLEGGQYGADYTQISGAGTVTLRFEGAQTVSLIPANTADTDGDPATDDRFFWWSNRGDESNTRMTRAFDLTGVQSATLSYDVWYLLEYGWDYGYITVSTDGGETYEILSTPHTTDYNPFGNAYGQGYTGGSAEESGASANGWLHEEIDLSAYAGQEILLSFETITDDAVNRPGMAIDNICIAELDACTDAESGDDGWEGAGFVRISNAVPQTFVVQLVIPDGGAYRVEHIEIDENNRGEITFTLQPGSPATLIVSGLARHTTEPAIYSLSIIAGG